MDYLYYPQALSDLIISFSRLPGVGPKTAGRLAFYLLQHSDDAEQLARTITTALREIRQCTVCGNYTEADPCKICAGERRDRTVLCIVEQPRDVVALEKTREFKGIYHVLHGVLSPMEGIGPEQLNLANLLKRLDNVKEVIIAVNPSVEGELEYADEVTITRALEGRRQL